MDELTPFPYRSWSTPTRREDASASFRVGEVERAAACDALCDHYAAGRLDPAELDDRLARAMAARSQRDLRMLFADLGPRRPLPAAVREPTPEPSTRGPATIPILASIAVMALLLAGGMLLLLGAYSPALFAAALVGGTATGVAGACVAVLLQSARRTRDR